VIGYHVEYLEQVNPGAVTLYFKYLIGILAWYYIMISIGKLAICMLYRRLFPQRSVLIVVYITAGVIILTAVGNLVVTLASCEPFSANWAPNDVQATHCINKEAFFIWGTIPNIITNVVLLALPLPIVWRLQTSTKAKVALTITFLFGSQ
jgi:hypothetical protein